MGVLGQAQSPGQAGEADQQIDAVIAQGVHARGPGRIGPGCGCAFGAPVRTRWVEWETRAEIGQGNEDPLQAITQLRRVRR